MLALKHLTRENTHMFKQDSMAEMKNWSYVFLSKNLSFLKDTDFSLKTVAKSKQITA